MAFDPWAQYNQGLANLGQTFSTLNREDMARQQLALQQGAQERQNTLADLQVRQGEADLQQKALNAPVEAKQRQATMISLDDKLAEYGAKVAAGQGDINEYYKSKQALERMKQMGEAIKPYANKPEALKSVWPELQKAFPEFKNIDPSVFKATPDGIMTPFKTPDGKDVPNMFYLYDNEGKMVIKEVKPEKPERDKPLSQIVKDKESPTGWSYLTEQGNRMVNAPDPTKAKEKTTIIGGGAGVPPKPGKVLPAGQLEALADAAQVLKTLEEAKTVSGKVDTGPIAGRWQTLKQFAGMSSDDFNQLKQKISTVENIMLKLRSGAAVTEQEYKRFLNEMPTVNDNEQVIKTKFANATAYMQDLLDGKLATYEEGGYKVPSGVQGRAKASEQTKPAGKTARPPLSAIFGR